MRASELIAVFVLFAVMAVTFMGFVTLSGTKEGGRESERMMEWRLLLQAVAVLFLIAGAFFLF